MKTTIIIPTLNAHEPWFLKAVASCAFADEIIITRKDGLTNAVNDAAIQASGDYIAVLPDDDYFLPEINEAIKNIDGDIWHFPCRHQIEDGEISAELFDVSPGITKEENLRQNRVHGSSFIKKNVFRFLGGYQGDICMDAHLWNRALTMGSKFVYYPGPCVVFRWNKHSMLQCRAGHHG